MDYSSNRHYAGSSVMYRTELLGYGRLQLLLNNSALLLGVLEMKVLVFFGVCWWSATCRKCSRFPMGMMWRDGRIYLNQTGFHSDCVRVQMKRPGVWVVDLSSWPRDNGKENGNYYILIGYIVGI